MQAPDSAPPAAFAAIPGPPLAPAAAPAPQPAARSGARHATLPDGRKLNLTISRKALFCDLAAAHYPTTLSECVILLHLCSPDFDPAEWWLALAPEADPDDGPRTGGSPFPELRAKIDRWADENFGPDDGSLILDTADFLWTGAHLTQVVPVEDAAAAEKKSRESSPTGPSNTSESSPEATSPSETGSSTNSRSGRPTRRSTRTSSPKE